MYNSTHNLQKLLQKIAEGDESAFKQFFLQAVIQLRPAISRLTRKEQDTEEIIQETFIKLWLHRDKLPDIQNLDGYIYKIAFYEYQIYLRKEIADHKREVLWQGTREAEDISFLQHIKAAELKELIQQAVDQLPAQRQLIYKMSRERGNSPAEIAQSLGISLQTVKNTLVVALQAIRAHLIAAGYTLPFLIYGMVYNYLSIQ